MRRDNVTEPSDDHKDGVSYHANFEYYPFKEGATYAVYKGVFNGEGRLHGDFCAVKTVLGRPGNEQDWKHPISRANKTQELAVHFNKMLGYPAVTCLVPVPAQMDRVSSFTKPVRKFFRRHEKRLKKGEWLCLEPFLGKQLEKFDSCASSQTHATSNESSRQLAEAFSHFTWSTTRTLVVTDLQGGCEGRRLTLTNPAIHSVDKQFGQTDRAREGIFEFFQQHKCNELCQNWETYLSVSKTKTESHQEINICQPAVPSNTGTDMWQAYPVTHGTNKKAKSVSFLLLDKEGKDNNCDWSY